MKRVLMLLTAFGVAVSAYAEFTCSVKVDKGDVGQSRAVTVSYAGGTSPSPLVRVEAGDGAYVRLSEADGWAKSVEFLALNGSGTQSFFCLADAKDAKLELSYTSGSSEAIPWTTLGPSLKPSYVSEVAWQYALAELKSRLGTTWSDYLSRLQVNTEYLSDLGYETCRTDRLLGLEINRALGINVAVPTLASATDISRSARGFPLSYSRSFSSATYAHFNKGVLGFGWTDNYSMCAELADEKTLVIRLPSGGAYSFSKMTGDWQPEDARDKTVLSETADEYALTDESETSLTFAKSNMRLKRMADNVGNVLTFAWGGVKLLSVTHSDGQSLTFSYTAAGLLASIKDDLGNVVTYEYDDKSMLTSVTGVDRLVTRYSYKTSGSELGTAVARALVSVTAPDQTVIRYEYDNSSAQLASVTDAAGSTVRLAYSDVARVEVTAADGGVTQVCMGPSGEALKTMDALGGVVTRTYDADGLLKSILVPSGRTSSYAHDARGRVTTQTSAADTVTAFDYTELFGNLKTLKDARGKSVTYGYDDKGRATSVQFADGSKMLVEYNARGDISKTTNCRGQSEAYTYDAEGRVSSRTWANGRTFTYAYDAKGRLVSASDSETGNVTMEYDAADRLTRIAYPDNRGFTFTYDSCGRLTKRQSFDGAAECFAYDAAGRLAEVTDGTGALYLRNTYDSTTGRLTKQTNGNGTSTDYLYDLLGRVISIEHKDAGGKIAEALQYCYDEDGRCIRAASLLGEERYGYDDEGQLTRVEYPVGENESFAYDAVGNRTSANGATYTVNALNQYTALTVDATSPSRQNELSTASFTYDADGNLTSRTDADGTTTYAYDQQNRLVAVKNAAKNLDWSCAYDVFGNRVSVTESGVTTKRVLLPGSLPSVAAEYRDGALVKRHVVVGAVRLAEIRGEAASSPLDQNNISYYHGDLIGSTRLMTDATGVTKSRLSYKSFGEVRSHYGEIPAAGYVGTLGVETDATGLLFMRNRYYDPKLGRFIQRDPIGLSGGDVNWYRYCGNSPIRSTDIIGLFAQIDDMILNCADSYDQAEVTRCLGKLVPSGTILRNRSLKKGSGGEYDPETKKILLPKQYDNSHLAHEIKHYFDDKAGLLDKLEPYQLEARAYQVMLDFRRKNRILGWFYRVLYRNKNGEDLIREKMKNTNLYDYVKEVPISSETEDSGGIGGDTDPEDPIDNIPESGDLSVIHDENTWKGTNSLFATVKGPFTISFEISVKFRLLSESGSMDFYVDGEWSAGSVAPESCKFTRSISGEGEHKLEWRLTAKFIKGYSKNSYPPITGSVAAIEITRPAKKTAAVAQAHVATQATFPQSSAASVVPHLYCFERYVAVKGCDYSFRLSASNGASISASGLPDGLSIVDGCITGKVVSDGTSSATILVGGTTKTVTFEVIDAPTGFAEQYASAGGTVVEPEDPEPEPVDETKTMTLALAQGWNWISLNIAPTDATLSSVLAEVPFADEDMVKSTGGVATYYGGSWYGELATLKPGVAYMVKKSTAGSATVAVAGAAVEPSVAVAAGWNWIGCTAAGEVSLDALSHSGGFSDEDSISSADGVATYYGGKWYGELKVLKPSVGYKAKFAKGGALTFGKGL